MLQDEFNATEPTLNTVDDIATIPDAELEGLDDDELEVESSGPDNRPSLLEKINEFGLERKLINIVINEQRVPPRLQDDAAQDIRIAWMKAKAKPEFSLSQTASYAHRIGTHSALRTRRELGSAVRLPGSAFRKRKDGTSYVTPGVLADPLDWDELAERLDAGTEDEDEAVVYDKTNVLAKLREFLDDTQMTIIEMVLNGMPAVDIAELKGVQLGSVHRQLNAIRRHMEANGIKGI